MLTLPRLNLSYDLAAFLPAPTTPAETLLTERLGQGPGAQLLFIQLHGQTAAGAARIADKLRNIDGVARVWPNPKLLSVEHLPAPVWQHRLLLQDLPHSQADWLDLLNSRLDDLSMLSDDDALTLVAADPGLFSVTTLEQFTANRQLTFNQGQSHYLIVETQVPGYDIGGQRDIVRALTLALEDVSANLLGSPAYGVALQEAVKFEATVFSTLAGVLLASILILRFRKSYPVIAIILPLITGGLAGLLALSLFFDRVHGITLAFGFTLLGVAIDYPLHLFLSVNEKGKGFHVWPTLRLGIISTLIAYGAFAFSGTQGIAQLGIFGFCGLITAAVTAWWLCPQPTTQPATPASRYQQLKLWPGLLVMATGLVALALLKPFNDNLAELTPIPKQTLQADTRIRQTLGISNIRYLIGIWCTDRQACIRRTTTVLDNLQPLMDQGVLGGAQGISQILPSRAQQELRRRELQNPQALATFHNALAQSPFAPSAFAPFVHHWQVTAASSEYLTYRALLEAGNLDTINSLLYPSADGWVSLIYLMGIEDMPTLQQHLAEDRNAQLVDLKATSERMVSQYRLQVFKILGLALTAIAGILIATLSLKRGTWLLITLGAAVTTGATISTLLHGGLSLFDLMALTLVAGLGLDYALFYSGISNAQHNRQTATAVNLCALSSAVVFGTLSWSTIPVLAGIGSTVFFGVITAYLLARFTRRIMV